MKFNQTPDGVSQLIASKWKIGAALAVALLLYFAFLILLPLADGLLNGVRHRSRQQDHREEAAREGNGRTAGTESP